MTSRDRRLDRVEEKLERASVRVQGDEAIQELFTTAELLGVIENRGEHQVPIMPWDGNGLLIVDNYTNEELQVIVDFEIAHPLEGGQR